MKLIDLQIKNVKSFNDQELISFDEKFNILIGPNGGGKSNLLDIVTIVLRKFFLQSFRVSEGKDNEVPFKDLSNHDPFQQIEKFLEKFIGNTGESEIVITFQITKGDVLNIKNIKKHKKKLEENLLKFRNKPLSNFTFCDHWDLRKLKPCCSVSYTIINNNLTPPKDSSTELYYLEYLKYLELFIILCEEMSTLNIRPIFLYFSPNRSINQQTIEANLSSESYRELLMGYFSSTSRNHTSLLQIAANYFAAKRRNYEGDRVVGYEEKWNNDEEVKLVTKYLNRLNYSWSLEQTDDRKNIYQINLGKDGKIFTIEQASSGEKEIINFLLGIFAFNIKYGTIIIDEPELHLHPKWQIILTDLFIELSKTGETDNQFILSTHSPTFIGKNTVSKTIRIYKDDENSSSIVCLEKSKLGSVKDLLHIVNSHNNEKIFFADKAVLVEGLHDRIIYEVILRYFLKDDADIIEVIEVHGKHNFDKYRKFLNSFKIKNFILADLDYLKQVGNDSVKSFFITNNLGIGKILQDQKSKDRKSLVEYIDQSIKNKDLKNLKQVWEYIKSKEVVLKNDISDSENQEIVRNICNLQNNKLILILEKGKIEQYLPDNFKTLGTALDLIKEKNLSKLVNKIKSTDLKNKIDYILKQ